VRGIGARIKSNKEQQGPAMDLRLLVLCFGNFIIGTGTLIVPGIRLLLDQ
jgi:hypothetical protein